MSITLALGLAPPRDEPGSNKSFNEEAVFLSSNKFSEALSSFGSCTNGGIASFSLAFTKSPSISVLNLNAPCLAKSFTAIR